MYKEKVYKEEVYKKEMHTKEMHQKEVHKVSKVNVSQCTAAEHDTSQDGLPQQQGIAFEDHAPGFELKVTALPESVTGRHTPDPLRFAFDNKASAHAGGSQQPISPDLFQSQFENVLLAAEKPANRCLYVHIPFCRVRCTYCNFFQHAASASLIEEYFDALVLELKMKAAQPWTQAAPFQAVYVGGGTPTDLTARQIARLGQLIRQYFPLTNDCEITLEGRINRFDDALFDAALEGGFNRFSFGVQSFNTQVRRKAKRLDDREAVLTRIQTLSARNDAPIVIDLLYGLPYQTMNVWAQDLTDFLDCGAHGVDLYQLIPMGSTPMMDLVANQRLPPPADTASKAGMFELGVQMMDKHHLHRLSVNHWARDNRERSLYNSLAKTSAEVLPLGAGAGGHVGGISLMQCRQLPSYFDAVRQGQHPVAMMMTMSPNAAVHAVIKAGFDRGALSEKALNRAAGWDAFRWCHPLFEVWQRNGLVNVQDSYLTLTLAGAFWSVTLAQGLIQVMEQALTGNERLTA